MMMQQLLAKPFITRFNKIRVSFFRIAAFINLKTPASYFNFWVDDFPASSFEGSDDPGQIKKSLLSAPPHFPFQDGQCEVVWSNKDTYNTGRLFNIFSCVC